MGSIGSRCLWCRAASGGLDWSAVGPVPGRLLREVPKQLCRRGGGGVGFDRDIDARRVDLQKAPPTVRHLMPTTRTTGPLATWATTSRATWLGLTAVPDRSLDSWAASFALGGASCTAMARHLPRSCPTPWHESAGYSQPMAIPRPAYKNIFWPFARSRPALRAFPNPGLPTSARLRVLASPVWPFAALWC